MPRGRVPAQYGGYMTLRAAAAQWKLSRQRVQQFRRDGRIDGATLVEHRGQPLWLLPVETPRPTLYSPWEGSRRGQPDPRSVRFLSQGQGMESRPVVPVGRSVPAGRAFGHCRIGHRFEPWRWCACGRRFNLIADAETTCSCGQTVANPFNLSDQLAQIAEYHRRHLADRFAEAGALSAIESGSASMRARPMGNALFRHLRSGDCLILATITRGWSAVRSSDGDARHELGLLWDRGITVCTAEDGLILDPEQERTSQIKACVRLIIARREEDRALWSRAPARRFHGKNRRGDI